MRETVSKHVTSRRLLQAVSFVLLGAVLLYVAAFIVNPVFNVPWRQIDLVGTWQVVSVGGSPTASEGRSTLAFETGRSYATLDAPCFTISMEYGGDTDGTDIEFYERGIVDHECSATDAERDAIVRSAFAGVIEWRVNSQTSIELLLGDNRPPLRLEKVGA